MTSSSFHQHDPYESIMSEQQAILRQKLNSKTEALLILSKELEDCRHNRDKWRALVEELRSSGGGRYVSTKHVDKILAKNLCDCKDKNRILQTDNRDLRQKLQDAEGDVKVLREQMARQQQQQHTRHEGDEPGTTTRHFPAHERSRLVEHLESIRMKYALLERDLQSILDEKEELVVERDAYRHKVERLNHELNFVLKGDEKKVIDIDSILMENRYLQERLKQTQEEKSLYLQTLSKYKNILEKRRNKSSLKLGSNSNGSVIITHKQVAQMLQDTSLSQLPATQATIADLRSLALALFESLNDKNVALAHQRKTNKILGYRLADLEKKLSKLEFLPECIMPEGSPDPPSSPLLAVHDDATGRGERDVCSDHDGTEKSPEKIVELGDHGRGGGQNAASSDPLCRAGDLVDDGDDSVKPVDPDVSEAAADWQIGAARSRQSSVGSLQSPCCQSPKLTESTRPKRASFNSVLAAATSSATVDDDDLTPELKKLVQDAMEDLDRRLTSSSSSSSCCKVEPQA